MHITRDSTTASQLASSTGRVSAVPSRTSIGTGAVLAAPAACSRNVGSGSIATTRVTVAGYCAKFRPDPAPTSHTTPARPASSSRRCSATPRASALAAARRYAFANRGLGRNDFTLRHGYLHREHEVSQGWSG